MGKLTAVEYLSLDGVMQSPGRRDEDTRGGFDLGGWASQALGADPEAAQASMGSGEGTRAMLFGRRTYDDLVGHWLSTTDPNPFTQILRDTPKYVASRDPDAACRTRTRPCSPATPWPRSATSRTGSRATS